MENESPINTTLSNDNESGATPIWFEFILDESLLERHLNNPNANPSATNLIALFLYQADIATTVAREINGKENTCSNGAVSDNAQADGSNNVDNKKIRVLRSLAVKTACHLKWNLSILEKSLPVAILRSLLDELLKIVSAMQDLSVKNHTQVDMSKLQPEALFAVLFYHHWALLTVVKNSFPVKPSKIASVQVPGLLDPSSLSAAMKDTVLKSLSEGVPVSIGILERYVNNGGREARIPVMSCIGSVNGDTDEAVHTWSNGILIGNMEMTCQVCYDLGCIYFFQQNYGKADIAFKKCKELLPKISSPVFMEVDESSLNGYLCACGGVLGRLPSDNFGSPLTIYQQVVASVRNNFQGLTGLLIEDLHKQELSWTFRATLEESTHLAKRSDSLYEEVLVCNTIRRSLDGRVSVFDLVKTMNRTVGLVDFFIQVCLDALKSLPDEQRENLKLFLRNLCHTISPTTQFTQKLLSCDLASLFSATEQNEMRSCFDNRTPSAVLQTNFMFPPPVDQILQIGNLERELLVTYDPVVVRALVPDLARKVGNNQAVYLTDKWMLPRDLQQCIVSMPIPEPTLAMVTHVLIAKSRICIQLQQYDKAHELLVAADTDVKDISYKLSRIIQWEILRVDLLQCIEAERAIPEQLMQELAKRCRSCVTSLQCESVDMHPSDELLSYCIALLLNIKDWDFLSSLSGRANTVSSGAMHFGQMIATLCKEVPQLKTARNSASKFLESVSLTFAENTQIKRNSSGIPIGTIQRESPNAILSQEMLMAFIGKIKEPVVLSLFVSCMTKLFNLVSIDITEEIFSDYIMLWPSSLPFSLSVSSVSEMVTWLMDHVLSVNPRHPSWLRTQADLLFAQGQYWQAMCFYLELGIVTTDFFVEPVTKNAYNDQVYRRMIRCCTQLNCHTQVAVLCQFFDEVDYAVAFKALQERVTHDAMDMYYNCIWDTAILEFLINLHAKRGERDKSQYVLRLMGQLELNSSNREDVLNEAERVRKSRFLRMIARQYLGVHLPQSLVPFSVAA